MPTTPAKEPDSAGRSSPSRPVCRGGPRGDLPQFGASPVGPQIYWGTTILFWVAALRPSGTGSAGQLVRRMLAKPQPEVGVIIRVALWYPAIRVYSRSVVLDFEVSDAVHRGQTLHCGPGKLPVPEQCMGGRPRPRSGRSE